jgi:YbgC/YbaW family acyl-CoA thioester hydrolase
MEFRVRYSETDQMGTFYYSRPLEWFECGRTELLRCLGLPYAEMEQRGVLLPVVEAHVDYLGRARYDDLLRMTSRGRWSDAPDCGWTTPSCMPATARAWRRATPCTRL